MDNSPDASHVDFTKSAHSDFGEVRLGDVAVRAKTSASPQPHSLGLEDLTFSPDVSPGRHVTVGHLIQSHLTEGHPVAGYGQFSGKAVAQASTDQLTLTTPSSTGQTLAADLYGLPEYYSHSANLFLDPLLGQVSDQLPIGWYPDLLLGSLPESSTCPLVDPSFGPFHPSASDLSLLSYNNKASLNGGPTISDPLELASSIFTLGRVLEPVDNSHSAFDTQALLPTASTNLDLLPPHSATTFNLDIPIETLDAGNINPSEAVASKLGPDIPSRTAERVSLNDSIPGESSDNQNETTTMEGLKYKWPGCRSNKTFKRKYEYNRHMKKHTRVVSLPCPVVYCPRQGSRSFYRWDKLFDHLRTGHSENETCLCLVDGCTAPQMSLNLLRLHSRNHDVDINKHPDLVTSCDFLKVLRSFSMARKCDLKKCKRWFGADDAGNLQEHLLRHSLEDRRSQSNVLREMGYDPVTAEVICPLCQQSFADSVQFVSHLEAAHLTTDSSHWLSFKRHIPTDSLVTTRYIWRGWENKFGGSEDCYCRYCGDYASSQSNEWIDHHLGLLTMSDEIKAARARILRLLPTFADHPIFEADMPTIHIAT